MKKIFFMAGLPRSGGTLISSILNQNPEIYVSPNSVLANIVGEVYNQYRSNENLDVDQSDGIYSVLDEIVPLFYHTRGERFVIDKNFNWTDKHLFSVLIKHLRNDIKIICPVRDVLHMAASWNRMCETDRSNQHDIDMLGFDNSERPMPDKRADYFMNGNRVAEKIERLEMFTKYTENTVLLVDYDDLVSDAAGTIDTIYDFLGIKRYDHQFDTLTTPHDYNDHWGVKNQHFVKPFIHKEEYDLSSIFSQETIDRYSNLEFWKRHGKDEQ